MNDEMNELSSKEELYSTKELSTKIEELRRVLSTFAEKGTLVIACSGGVDSRFLAHISHSMGFAVELIHVHGPHMPKKETEMLRQWCSGAEFPRAESPRPESPRPEEIEAIAVTEVTEVTNGAERAIGKTEFTKNITKNIHVPFLTLHEIYYSPLVLPEVKHNTKERCYHCKQALFSAMLDYCQEHIPNAILCDGSQHSDTKQFRPGMKALKELGIYSPLALANFEKSHIRAVALEIGLERPFQHGKACLFTRFDYGRVLTETDLTFVAHVENIVEIFLLAYYDEKDMPEFRLREITSHKSASHANTIHANTIYESTNHEITSNANTSHENTSHENTSHENTSHENTSHENTSHENTSYENTNHKNTIPENAKLILHSTADIPNFSALQSILLQDTLCRIEMEIVPNISGYFDKK